jgi:hypothetical protein
MEAIRSSETSGTTQRTTRRHIPEEDTLQFFIIYVPSQQLQSQSQTQHSVDTGNYIKDRHNMKTTASYNNNSIEFFIINVPSQQLQSQSQTQHSVDKQIQL